MPVAVIDAQRGGRHFFGERLRNARASMRNGDQKRRGAAFERVDGTIVGGFHVGGPGHWACRVFVGVQGAITLRLPIASCGQAFHHARRKLRGKASARMDVRGCRHTLRPARSSRTHVRCERANVRPVRACAAVERGVEKTASDKAQCRRERARREWLRRPPAPQRRGSIRRQPTRSAQRTGLTRCLANAAKARQCRCAATRHAASMRFEPAFDPCAACRRDQASCLHRRRSGCRSHNGRTRDRAGP